MHGFSSLSQTHLSNESNLDRLGQQRPDKFQAIVQGGPVKGRLLSYPIKESKKASN